MVTSMVVDEKGEAISEHAPVVTTTNRVLPYTRPLLTGGAGNLWRSSLYRSPLLNRSGAYMTNYARVAPTVTNNA